jgi:hypothetical protein
MCAVICPETIIKVSKQINRRHGAEVEDQAVAGRKSGGRIQKAEERI